jgi:hypothetical protein
MWCLLFNFALTRSSLMSRPKYTRYIVGAGDICGHGSGDGARRAIETLIPALGI